VSNTRVLVLMHEALIPDITIPEESFDRDKCPHITEYDVVKTLTDLGNEVLPLGVISDLRKIRNTIDEFKPHIVFNLLEEFDGEAVFDQNVVSYLELLRIPYTGCNPRGLMIGRDKSLSKKILTYHDIPTPSFYVFPKSKKTKKPDSLEFPLIVKCLSEEASLGISQASVVHNEEKLMERVQYINQKLGVDAIAEQFIAGREFFLGILGNHQLKPLPVWELQFENSSKPNKEFYSNRAKFNKEYRQRKGVKTHKADISQELEEKMAKIGRTTYQALELNGYARIDMRMDQKGKVYVIEANPNPDISREDEFAESAKHNNIDYPTLLSKILSLAKSWHNYEN
jgi:D-alanine-D-alanine ligase